MTQLCPQDPGTLAHSLQMTAFQSVQQQVPAAAPERAASMDSLDSPAMAAAMAESAAAGAIPPGLGHQCAVYLEACCSVAQAYKAQC